MPNKNLRIALLAGVLTVGSVPFAFSQAGSSKSTPAAAMKIDNDLSDRIRNSAEVLQSMMSAEDKRIPQAMLERAEAIAVIPHVIKGAFGIGGRYGKGLMSQRLANGRWSAPTFVSIGGGSFGAQLGVTATDLVLVFTDKDALKSIGNGMSLKLGADAAVAAGPLGRAGEAGVTADLKSGIYAYSRSKGLFAGVALDGAVIDIDQEANQKVIGANADTKTILSSDRFTTNAHVSDFVKALDKAAPRKTQ